MSENDLILYSYNISSYDEFELMVEFVVDTIIESKIPSDIGYIIHLIVDEVTTNVITYNHNENSDNTTLQIDIKPEAGKVTLIFKDNGKKFNPLKYENTNVQQFNLAEREIGGLGIFLIRQYADELNYEYKDGFNILTFVKKWN